MARTSNYDTAPRKRHRLRSAGIAVVAIGLAWGADRAFNNSNLSGSFKADSANIGPAMPTAHPTKYVNAQVVAADPYVASFNTLARTIPGDVGLAYTSIGKAGIVHSYGTLISGPAWSTSKVPVALAYEAQVNGNPDVAGTNNLERAITQSNNDAANALWAQLGSNAVAAQKTQAVLRAGDDATSTVPSQWSNRPGIATIFGQTEWSLSDQARFAAHLKCIPYSAPVIRLMGQIIPSQSWGIGKTDAQASSVFKDGWSASGAGQLTRQMAIVHTPRGEDYALTMATTPSDGNFATGQANITALAQWAVATIEGVPKGSC